MNILSISHIIPKSTQLARRYTTQGIAQATRGRSTPSLVKEAVILRALGNQQVSGPLSRVVNNMPNAVIDTPPISWTFRPIASQFGTVNANLKTVLDQFGPHEVADLAKEGIAADEDPKVILDRHILTVEHPKVRHMALKLSSFVPFSTLQSGLDSPTYRNGVDMMHTICRLAQQYGKKIYIDAEGVPEQRLIEKAQLALGEKFNDTVYLTFQSTRSDTLFRLEDYLTHCLKSGLTPLIKQVKGAYQAMESKVYPNFYHQTFEDTDRAFRTAITLVGEFPGNKHQFIGTMNPELIQYAYARLNPGEYSIANLKGMEVAPAMNDGWNETLIYHPIALIESELAKYGMRRLFELGNAENLTSRRSFVVEAAVKQRFGIETPLPNFLPKISEELDNAVAHRTFNVAGNAAASSTDLSVRLIRSNPNRYLSLITANKIRPSTTVDTIQRMVAEDPAWKTVFTTEAVRDILISIGESTLKDPLAGIKRNKLAVATEATIAELETDNPAGKTLFDTPKANHVRKEMAQNLRNAMEHPGF